VPKQTLIYWRDIPAQVIVQQGRRREKVKLSTRFEKAIDRAAMRAGKGSSDLYLEEWRRESSMIETDEDIKTVAEQQASILESEYSDDLLLKLIRNLGSAGG
jgi:hypothetical protein